MMEPILVDTDVFSFFLKRDTRREQYSKLLVRKQLCLSFQSLAELKRWALQRNWSSRTCEKLADALQHYVIIPFDAPMADAWAKITVHRQQMGRPIECGDAWVAATAVRHSIPLATHNTRDYADVPDLKVLV